MEDRRGEIRAKIECSDNPLSTLISEARSNYTYYGNGGLAEVVDAFCDAKIPSYLLDTEPDPSRRYYLTPNMAPRMDAFPGRVVQSVLRVLVRAAEDGVHPYHLGETYLVPREDRTRMMNVGVKAASTGSTLEDVIREAYQDPNDNHIFAEKKFFIGVVSYLYQSGSRGNLLGTKREVESGKDLTFKRLLDALPGDVIENVEISDTKDIPVLVSAVNDYYNLCPDRIGEILPKKLALENLDDLEARFIGFDVIDRLADYYQSYFREQLKLLMLAGEKEVGMQVFWFGVCGGEPSDDKRDFKTCANEIMERLVELDWQKVDLSTLGTFGAWIEEVGLNRDLAVLVARAMLDD